ncbi:MAG: SMC-Scp complex subunit ScpB, partial [Alphaproteobacteria bacterium]|nr:SMC-Scp complex subunit ScpB [Alphaproteobacteria bacterium]
VATHKGTLDTLMEMGWIKPGRRRETPGRPLTWVSTTEFMDAFSLESLMDLPGMDDLKAAGLLDRRPAIEAIPQADLFSGQKRMDGVEGLSRAEDEDEDEESDPDFSDEVLNGHNTDEESGEEALEELI